MNHVVNGIAIIESWANGRGFGRVDLDVDLKTKGAAATLVKVHPPRRLCGDDKANDTVAIEACAPSAYEGQTPVVDQRLLKKIEPYFADAKARRAAPLEVHVHAEIKRGYDRESPLGNLFADLMLASSPGSDVALMNGGGIRANLPPGPLLYGSVFEMMPFDNRMAVVTMSAADLKAILARNLAGTKKGGIFSTAGVQVTIRCDDLGRADLTLTRTDGRALNDDTLLKVVTTDFIATGGDGGLGLPPDRVVVDEGEPLREHLALALRKRGGTLKPDDPAIAPPTPRLHRPGAATARCGGT
jgi:5'-nucleotidase